MANMYPKNISEYMPTDSERIVYHELKTQLPDTYDVFYSVKWTSYEDGVLVKSEADFIVVSPDYGFLCLEVKGGSGIRVEDNVWYVNDTAHGERKLQVSPYDQAEKSMYFFKNTFSNKYNTRYQGIYGAGVIFPFYSVASSMELDNRSRTCTIDSHDLNDIHNKVKKMFRLWGGSAFGRQYYSNSQHKAFLELVRERVAIAAAAGALVQYKERQLSIINRVQENYIYFLSNVRQFYIRGGAGTGKTWIAMKMAVNEAKFESNKVLYLCSSKTLANSIRNRIGNVVEVFDIASLFEATIEGFELLEEPLHTGVYDRLKEDHPLFDAIFVDEAQDFTREWARLVRRLLRDQNQSRFGIFYDDVQVLRQDSFSDGFGIASLPYLLHENIRNTSNIYSWAAEKTNLGTDMIVNPVEGPTPQTEIVTEKGQQTLMLESLFKKYLVDEHLPTQALTILTDDVNGFVSMYPDGISKWKFSRDHVESDNVLRLYSVEEYKGLESDMVIYVHAMNTTENVNYIAYTRAKYYLIELVRNY